MKITEAELPADIRFDVLPENGGQIVEYSHSIDGVSVSRASRFLKIEDRSMEVGDGRIEYFRRTKMGAS